MSTKTRAKYYRGAPPLAWFAPLPIKRAVSSDEKPSKMASTGTFATSAVSLPFVARWKPEPCRQRPCPA